MLFYFSDLKVVLVLYGVEVIVENEYKGYCWLIFFSKIGFVNLLLK